MTLTVDRARLACLASSIVALALPATAQAVVVPDAAYTSRLTYPPPAQQINGPGGISVDTQWLTGGGTDRGRIAATAATSNGLLPTAAISIGLAGTGFATLPGEAYAGLIYYWAVEQVGGTPRNTARVRIHVEGSVSSALIGDAGASPLYAEASINFVGSVSDFVAGVKPGTTYRGDKFDATFTKLVGKDSVFTTSLVAYGLANAGWNGGAGTARLDAFVDPLIEIDPDWDYADDFRVVFSRGVGIAAIPEPATWLLLLGGLAPIFAARHRPRRNRRAA